MTKIQRGNIFGAGTVEILGLFEDYVDGDANRSALALSYRPLGGPARDAIAKSLEAFGHGPDSCSYVSVFPQDESVEGGDIPLDGRALFMLVEGLDPLQVVCADARAAALLGQAYRTEFALDAPARVFGRPGVVFADLEALMESDAGKQKAWKLLKSLPKRS